MLTLLNFAIDIANVIDALIPIACYLIGLCLVIGSIIAIYAIGESGRGQTRTHLGIAIGSFVLGVVLVNFDRFLTALDRTLASNHTATVGGGLLAYKTAPDTIVGATPADTFLAVLNEFAFFFWSFGALMVLRGLLKMKRAGREQGQTIGGALVHIAFGGLLMNIDVIAPVFFSYG
jgi:hypothetical protein